MIATVCHSLARRAANFSRRVARKLVVLSGASWVSSLFWYQIQLRKGLFEGEGHAWLTEARNAHAEVVDSVSEHLQGLKIPVRGLLNKGLPLSVQVESRFDSIVRGSTSQVIFASRRLAMRNSKVLVTTDWADGYVVLGTAHLGRDNTLCVVHNTERFFDIAWAMQRARNSSGVVFAAPQVKFRGFQHLPLVKKPLGAVGRVSKEESNSNSPSKFLVVGLTLVNEDILAGLFRALDEVPSAHLTIVGRRDLLSRVDRTTPSNVAFLGLESEVNDAELEKLAVRADFLLFPKDPSHYLQRWSGSVALSLSFGIPLVAPRPLLTAWALSEASGVSFDYPDFSAALRAAMAIPPPRREQMREALLAEASGRYIETDRILKTWFVGIQ